MGKGPDAQVVGYRYSLGMGLAVCVGPVDAVAEILVDDRTAWRPGTTGTGPASDPGAEPVTLTNCSATQGSAEDGVAAIAFDGRQAGVRIGDALTLTLADASTVTVTIETIIFDAENDTTRWQVTPRTIGWPAQTVTTTLPVRDQLGVPTDGPAVSHGAGGRIVIDRPDLFGGEDREGGVVGAVDIAMGAPGQAPNDYLVAKAGPDTPGYRGVLMLVLRQVYLGLSYYLKPWAVRVQRILTAEDGAEQWYPETAVIASGADIADTALYIALDRSDSMAGSRLQAQYDAIAILLAELRVNATEPNDIRIVTYAGSVISSITRRDIGDQGYQDLVDHVTGLGTATQFGTDYAAAVSGAADFFAGAGDKARVVVFVTDGEPVPSGSSDTAAAVLQAIPGVQVFGFNIQLADTSQTAKLDTTPGDGVPVIPTDDPEALAARLRFALATNKDMNPAHILRECLTNAEWGRGYADPDIGPSFTAAADTLHAEGFGLSFLYRRDGPIEAFIADVLAHIDGELFIDRRTGLWELTLVRDDYDVAALPIFDVSNVVDWGTPTTREPVEAVDSVTVRYSDRSVDRQRSVTLHRTARAMTPGNANPQTVDYPGISFEALAVRVAARDLAALSAPLLSVEITVTREGSGLNPGDAILLHSPERGIESAVMRVGRVTLGDGRANGIRLSLVQDVFSLGATAAIGGAQPRPPGLTSAATALDGRAVFEAPYWALVQALGHTEAEQLIGTEPDAGRLAVVAATDAPDTRGVQVWAGNPALAEVGAGRLGAVATLAADLDADPTSRTVAVSGWIDLAGVATGDLALIGEEIVRIDGVSATELVVGRGCLDSVPEAHLAGTALAVWTGPLNLVARDQVAGDALGVRLLPVTSRGPLPLAEAPEDTVSFASRAIRPLPVGRFQASGSYDPDPSLIFGAGAALSWAHRDRLAQTGSFVYDHLAPSIGPEPGVSYDVEIRYVDPGTDTPVDPPANVIGVGTATSYTVLEGDLVGTPPVGATECEIAVVAKRSEGGTVYRPLRSRAYRFLINDPGVDVILEAYVGGTTGGSSVTLDLGPAMAGAVRIVGLVGSIETHVTGLTVGGAAATLLARTKANAFDVVAYFAVPADQAGPQTLQAQVLSGAIYRLTFDVWTFSNLVGEAVRGLVLNGTNQAEAAMPVPVPDGGALIALAQADNATPGSLPSLTGLAQVTRLATDLGSSFASSSAVTANTDAGTASIATGNNGTTLGRLVCGALALGEGPPASGSPVIHASAFAALAGPTGGFYSFALDLGVAQPGQRQVVLLAGQGGAIDSCTLNGTELRCLGQIEDSYETVAVFVGSEAAGAVQDLVVGTSATDYRMAAALYTVTGVDTDVLADFAMNDPAAPEAGVTLYARAGGVAFAAVTGRNGGAGLPGITGLPSLDHQTGDIEAGFAMAFASSVGTAAGPLTVAFDNAGNEISRLRGIAVAFNPA